MVRYLHEYLCLSGYWGTCSYFPIIYMYMCIIYGGKVVPKTDEAWGAGKHWLSTQCHLRIHSLVPSLSYTCVHVYTLTTCISTIVIYTLLAYTFAISPYWYTGSTSRRGNSYLKLFVVISTGEFTFHLYFRTCSEVKLLTYMYMTITYLACTSYVVVSVFIGVIFGVGAISNYSRHSSNVLWGTLF